MTITYTWLVKHLTADMRGNATIAFFEMQGIDENGNSKNGSVTVCFGGSELKALSQWTQEDIDSYAETKRSVIEETIAERFTTLEST